VKSFTLQTPMVVAAAVTPAAQTAIDRYLSDGRRRLRDQVRAFMHFLRTAVARRVSADELQERFMRLRLKFNAVLADFDTFADALSQRSEHETGVWLSGLDAVAADALRIPERYYEPPPIICYLDRGFGAAIRRARTRLPTGGRNPVAIIQVPRERMVGSGIASSLIHEVGHQAADLLDLMASIRPLLRGMQHQGGPEKVAWMLWERWMGEIVADFWSVARVGVASTLGLMGVVSLPRVYVFHVRMDDPHPAPWIRVKLSCAVGAALYPHPQWVKLAALWESLYPPVALPMTQRLLFGLLERSIPALVALLTEHRPARLRGRSLREVLGVESRQPARLLALWHWWRRSPLRMRASPPSLVFAVIGQGKMAGLIGPEEESRIVAELLTFWALRSSWETAVGSTAIGETRPLFVR